MLKVVARRQPYPLRNFFFWITHYKVLNLDRDPFQEGQPSSCPHTRSIILCVFHSAEITQRFRSFIPGNKGAMTKLLPLGKGSLKDPPSITEIEPRLFLGNITCLLDQDTIKGKKISASISLLTKPLEQWKQPQVAEHIQAHKFVSCTDNMDEDILHT